MTDYSKLSKNELIDQLKALEARIESTNSANPDAVAAAAALEDSEERIRAILETAVEGIITIDEHGIIESANPAAERIFAYTSHEIIGQNVSVLMPSPDREQHDRYLANYLRTGRAKIIGIGREVVGRRKDGELFPMDLSVSEVRLANKRLFTGFVRDITERKRLEQEILEISNREQRRIGQDLHDGLCQHLAAVELMAEVLEQNLERKGKGEAAQAARIAEYVRESISQTRMLARGLFPVELESEGLMAALEELAANTKRLFRVSCRFECAQPVLVRDHAAATHLYRIAQEAINNALKHGKARNIGLHLVLDGDQACLTVTDDGKGIPEELQTNRGMGLRIMEYRAGMIGGSLQICRTGEKGTTVSCTFKVGL